MIKCPHCQYAVAGKKKICEEDIRQHIQEVHTGDEING